MKTILYNPIFINPQAYYVFPRLTRYLQPDNESTAEPANYIGTIEVKVIAYGDTTLKRTYTNTDSIDLSEFKNTWIRISLFTKVGSCVLGEWKIGNMESDLPYIDPEVLASLKAVVIVGNKTNNDSDRAIVKNLVDPDNPFVISNAAFKLNSGFGKYSADFESFDWAVNISQKQHNKATISLNGRLCNHAAIEVDEMKVNIIGNVTELIYWYIANPDDTTRSEIRLTSGINTLPKSYAKDDGQTYNIGFAYISGDSEITIEQIPSFEGAFVTDGIDDLITSTKTVQEMLGGSNEITVVSMIHQVKDSSNNVSFTNYIRGSANGYFRNIVNNYDKTGIYGYTSSDLMGLSVVNNILGDKNDYTSNGDNRDSIINGNFSVQGYSYNDGNNTGDFSSVAWYWTIIANKVLTTDQINQVIAYFNLDRTLKSDIYCNIAKQGITNENHAEFGDKLIDFSGNGRDIQLNNIAWDGDSGIGKYNYPNWKVTATIANTYSTIVNYPTVNGTYSINVNGVSELMQSIGLHLEIKYTTSTGIIYKDIKQDGVYSYILPDGATDLTLRFGGIPGTVNEPCNITITQIPSHAGALCLDGVNDFGKVTGMPVYKDYTFIIDRQIISIGDTAGIVASKSEDSTDVNKQGAFLFEYLGAPNNISAWSFYKDNGKVANTDFTRGISYQSKYSYNGIELLAGTALDSDKLWLGILRDRDSRFANVAIYSLMSFPYSMSKFLIERQLKKQKLGTFYPNMVEFRPVINSNIDIKKINYWDKDWNILHIGDYVSIGNDIKTNITVPNGYKISKVTSNAFDNITIEKSSTEFIYDVKFYGIKKSPQKISITIEQDENYVLFNPVINSNYDNYKLTFHLREYEKLINIGDYIPKGTYIRANLYLKNNIDELVTFTFNGVNIDYVKSSVPDLAYNIRQIYNYDSPQEVNITIDEYIRYEDIVQPYPVLLRFNDENGNKVSWGGKVKLGSSITRIGSFNDCNLLKGIYTVSNAKLNGSPLPSTPHVVERQMVFTCTATYLLDDNEPNCILSPRLLRIPNSSYKILGHIPDISGHGNHGKINNSAYAEGSGVNADGSYQLDGVDDFITIPTTVGGKQVLMKVNWQSIAGTAILYDQRTNGGFAIFNRDFDTNENKVPAYRARNIGGSTYIDGILNEYIYASELKDITHNIVELCDPELNTGTLNPKIGSSYLNSNYTQMSLYDFMLFDEISTDDKIQELNKYVGIEAKVELPPYYWDTYGKTNSDADRDTIQQRGVAVGDYDLINYNHAYEGMSGYNGYPVVFGKSKTWEAQGTKDGDKYYIYTSNANKFNITQIKISSSLFYTYIKRNGELTSGNKDIPSFNLKVTGLDYDKFYLAYCYLKSADVEVRNVINITSDGIYELPKSFASDGSLTETNSYIGLSFIRKSSEIPDIIQNVNVTIEVLPEYENGLAYDGVEDYSENVNVPALTDYTYIFKRTLLNKKYNSASIFKGSNQQSGGGAFICDYNSVEPDLLTQGYSFGAGLYVDSLNADSIVYGTRGSVNGQVITSGNNTDTEGLTIGKWRGYKQMVFYKLILYPKTISLLEINFLKNLMEKDEIIDLTNPIFIQE